MTAAENDRKLHPLEALRALAGRGVIVPEPGMVAVGREVVLENISAEAVLHPFCRITGAATRIGPGAEIGPGGPATLHDSWVGERAVIGRLGPVTLRGAACGPGTVLGCGEAEEAVFLGKELPEPGHTTGYGFRVRKGSLYEEDANSAQHTDTKMTVLFPWVTLGSNVNWCDVLVAGGTGPDLGAFTEVGSGAIHFNFTPRGDKATASAFGGVVEGVFLDRPRLFIGGNGSLIGPLAAAFGAVTTAGGRFSRRLQPGLNLSEGEPPASTAEGFDLEVYGSVRRLFAGQVAYIGELAALKAWYGQARALVAKGEPELEQVYCRAGAMVELNIAERIAQLGRLAAAMERSAALLEKRGGADPRIAQQRALLEGWPRIEVALGAAAGAGEPMPEALREGLLESAAREGRVYTRVVRGLDPQAMEAGRAWLRSVRGRVAAPEILETVPEIPPPA